MKSKKLYKLVKKIILSLPECLLWAPNKEWVTGGSDGARVEILGEKPRLPMKLLRAYRRSVYRSRVRA